MDTQSELYKFGVRAFSVRNMIKKVAIIGGGVIGGGWAARFLLNGLDVYVYDPDPNAEQTLLEVIDNARFSLPMLYESKLPNEGKIKFCKNVAQAVVDADWIQESVPERLNVKHDVYEEIQTSCKTSAIIASSTSGFKPSELQENSKTPEKIIVCHPFNPVYLLPLIEVVGSDKTSARDLKKAMDVLTKLGFFPLHVRKEIDAHLADRFLEAVWREALWLIKDDIATTSEIDNAIRYGFGLRWAQMGLFETYRIAGGKAGMQHFLSQFGPCLQWPWTKLMDVPDLTDELVKKIAYQSDSQSGDKSIRELERTRDKNLVAILRSLKQQNFAAGNLISNHEKMISEKKTLKNKMIVSVDRVIPVDWTDYNGHMNEGRYGQVFSDAADGFLSSVGVDSEYIASGNSYFTVENHIKYLNETLAGEHVYVDTSVLLIDGKKLKLFHTMRRKTDKIELATCEQFLLHVDLNTRKSSEPVGEVASKLQEIFK